jgi:hypothetical protein
VPLATAATVLVLVLGTYAVMAGGSGTGGGPDRDRRAIDVPAPPIPTVHAVATDLAPQTARITGYRVTDRTLTISYTVSDRGCTRLVVRPLVRESAQSVTVLLQRTPAPELQLIACPTMPYEESTVAELTAPLGDRVVRDAASDDAVVSALR